MSGYMQKLALLSYQQVFIIGLALGGGYYFMLFDSGASLEQNIQQLQGNIQAEEAKKKQTDDNLAKEKQMRDLVGLLGKQFQEVSQKLPAELNSTELKRQLDAFAKTSRVTIRSFEPSEEKRVDIVNEIPANIAADGTYSQIAQFVDLISKSEKVMSIRNISIEPRNSPAASSVMPTNLNQLTMVAQVVGYQMVVDDHPASGDNSGGVK